MPYTPTTWVDSPSTSTPVNATNLNHAESGIQTAQSTAEAAVAKSLVTAKGDLIAATASGVVARVPAGTDTYVLTADAAQAAGVKWAAAAAGGGPGPQLISTGNAIYHVFDDGQVTAAVSWAVGSIATAPFPVDRACTADRIGTMVQTGGGAGAVLRLGIYSDDGGGRPGTLLVDAGTVASTSTGYVELTISQALTAGLYHLALVAQTATCSLYVTNGVTSGTKIKTNPGNLLQFCHVGFVHNGTVAGALPATFVPVDNDGNPKAALIPRIAVRIT